MTESDGPRKLFKFSPIWLKRYVFGVNCRTFHRHNKALDKGVKKKN